MTDSGQQKRGLAWLAEGSGRHPGRRLAVYAWRTVILIVIPVGLLTVMVAGSLATYRAVQAAVGNGTKGYFVSLNNVVGEFRLPDGQVTRPQVTIADPPPGLGPGAVIPALDTGDVTYVFSRHGSRHWETTAGVLAFIVLAFGAWLWFVPLRIRHMRRAVATEPASAASTRAKPGRLTVRSAAAYPTWITFSIALLNGDVSTRRINTALKAAADAAAYPLLVTAGVPLTDTDRAMYPVSGKSDRLAAITQTVTSLVTGHGALAASVADSTGWMFLIYTGSAEWLPAFEDQLRSELGDHLVVFRARHDRRWQAYRDLWRLAPRRLRARERIVLLTVVPVCCGAAAARYGLGWAAAGFLSAEAWALIVAFVSRDRLISAQLAHHALSWLAITGVLWTALFPAGALWVHPASPWVCAAGAAVVAMAITAALWPAQRKYYARIRASAAARQTAGPTA
jgi:hypothetical protein